MEKGSNSDADVAFAFSQSNFTDGVLPIEIMGDSIHPQPDSEGCTTIADKARVRRSEDIEKENGSISDANVASAFSHSNFPNGFLPIEKRGDDIKKENGSISNFDVASAFSQSNFTDGVLPIKKRGEDIEKENSSISNVDVASAFSQSSFTDGVLPIKKRGEDIKKENGFISDANVASAFSHSNFTNGFPPIKKRGDDIEKENGSISNIDVASAFSQSNFTDGVLPIEQRSEDIEKENGSIFDADIASAFNLSNFTDGVLPIETRGEVMSLPLAGLEAILSSDDLQVASEDAVFEFVLKWARKHYGNLEERQEVLGARLARLICFPYMTSQRLKKVLTCSDFDHDVASKLVLEALLFKVEAPHPVWSLAAEESASLNCPFKERAYKYHPVKVVNFKLPRQQCVVYMDLKREVCANLFPSGRVYSQPIYFGGLGFFLSGQCNMNQQSSFHCFGLFLGTQEKCPVSFNAELEFAARSSPTEEFVYKYKRNYTIKGGKAIGYPNIFGIPWTSFMAGDCAYFINDVLHLRAKLTIKD